MMPDAPGDKISVIIITRNEERCVEACLKSVAFADEIIVVDDESHDRTPEICRSFPKVVFFERRMADGFGVQKNFALSKASCPWVLSIDADEQVTESLRQEILSAVLSPGADGFRLGRRNLIFGRWLTDEKAVMVRFFRRDKGVFTIKKVDEAVVVSGKVSDFAQTLDHKSASHASIKDYYRIIVRERSLLTAHDLWSMGRRVNIFNAPAYIVLRPLAIFFQKLILKNGWRYGWRGWVLAYFSSWAYALSYIHLWRLKGGCAGNGS